MDYFQEKLMKKYFINSKKIYFGTFFPKFGKKWIFLGKRALSVFKYSNYLTEKTKEPFLGKMQNWHTGRWTERQWNRLTNADFIGPSVGQGSKHFLVLASSEKRLCLSLMDRKFCNSWFHHHCQSQSDFLN